MERNNKIFTLIIITIFGVVLSCKCQTISLSKYQVPFSAKGILLYRLNSDTLFGEKQNVIVAEIKRKALRKNKLVIAYADSSLKQTSKFAEENNAVVALNGGFFNVEKGGSVAYLESHGKVIARKKSPKEKWAKTDSLLNGAIIIDNSGKLKIEVAKSESYYENSAQEKEVLVSGPALLAKGQKLELENSAFVHKKHPRTCMCTTETGSILLIAIDGRSEVAAGMNLKEVQEFLLRLQCRDAINLDGGGSTTLWVNDGKQKGILNQPSDKEGERPVANVILIRN